MTQVVIKTIQKITKPEKIWDIKDIHRIKVVASFKQYISAMKLLSLFFCMAVKFGQLQSLNYAV